MCLPSERSNLDTWEWFEFSPRVEIELLPQEEDTEGAGDVFELCLIVRPFFRISLSRPW